MRLQARLLPTAWPLACALATGLAAGLVVTAFRLAMGGLGGWRNATALAAGEGPGLLVLPLIGAAGGALAGWLAARFAPDAAGGGVPDVIQALRDGATGPRLRFRAVWVKFAGGAIGIGGGLSLGREGPSIHIGAGIGAFVARTALPGPHHGVLILAGAAGGMAAAFNTPLAAIAFALEALRADQRPGVILPVIASAVAGDAVARALVGNYVAFPFATGEPGVAALPAFLLLGAACGVLGHVYKRVFVGARRASAALAPRLPRAWHPAVVGALTGALGLYLPDVMGGGQNLVTASLYVDLALAAVPLVFGLKLLASGAAYGSGAPGGYFGPALVLGAMAGLVFGRGCAWLAPGTLEAAAMVPAGMAALLAAALHLPLTAAILTIELTGQLGGLLPMLGAVVVAVGVAMRLEPRSLSDLLAPGDPEA